MTHYSRLLKRLFDIVVSAIGLVVLSIPMLIIAFLIRLTSPGPALYMQKRVGRFGRVFSVIKFRTMYLNSEKQGSVTTAIDKRITPVGRILRRWKLDELPQLWNVFTGSMSFVGPRPDVPGYADRLEGEARKILELRPGITGPATLYFRNEEDLLATAGDPKEYNDSVIWPKKVELNLEYINTWGFWKDLRYIVKTFYSGAGSKSVQSSRQPKSPEK